MPFTAMLVVCAALADFRAARSIHALDSVNINGCGNITAGGEVKTGTGISLENHVHTEVTPGSCNTGPATG
jgi:hypothetical protein